MLNILKRVYFQLLSANNKAKIVGVKYGKNPKFRTKYFGSEPYLIEVGDNFETFGDVYFITHDGSIGVLRNLYTEFQEMDFIDRISIGNNVFIGINVTILLGTKIGDNVIVGAGSIVKGELKSNSVYAGTPVKFICTIEKYKERVKNKLIPTYLMDPSKKEAVIKNKFNII